MVTKRREKVFTDKGKRKERGGKAWGVPTCKTRTSGKSSVGLDGRCANKSIKNEENDPSASIRMAKDMEGTEHSQLFHKVGRFPTSNGNKESRKECLNSLSVSKRGGKRDAESNKRMTGPQDL